MVRKIKGSFLFKITGSDGQVQEWLVNLKTLPGSVTKGKGARIRIIILRFYAELLAYRICCFRCVVYVRVGLKGNCTLSMKDSDFMELVSGKLGGQKVRL